MLKTDLVINTNLISAWIQTGYM